MQIRKSSTDICKRLTFTENSHESILKRVCAMSVWGKLLKIQLLTCPAVKTQKLEHIHHEPICSPPDAH